MTDHLAYALSMIGAFHGAVDKDLKILDLGCGSGWLVKKMIDNGYNAYGCDLAFKPGEHVELLHKESRIRLIDEKDYRLPFDDNCFDVIVSFQVLEHVQDIQHFARENKRVLKNGGHAIHIFPARWRPLESHIFVPFGGVIQNFFWYLMFTAMGFCKTKQKTSPVFFVARNNINYIRKHTNYKGRRFLLSIFSQEGLLSEFREKTYLSISQNKLTRFLSSLPMQNTCAWLYSALWRRVFVVQKSV